MSSIVGIQHTLSSRVDITGIGVHSGESVNLSILPSCVDSGIVFRRTDILGCDIPAVLDSVLSTDLCTIIGSATSSFHDNYVMTIEHLLSSLVSLGVDNAVIELDGPEVPILDGSSAIFVESILDVGLVSQSSLRRYLRVLRDFRFEFGDSWAEFSAYDGTRFDIEIDFVSSLISRQRFSLDLDSTTFCSDISSARTFGFRRDAERLRSNGFALGTSLDNTIIIDESDSVMNPDGLRYCDEFVRHKLLDSIGDLSLSGSPLLGCYRSYRGGHKLNILALRALMDSSDSWEWSDIDANPVSLGVSDISVSSVILSDSVAIK